MCDRVGVLYAGELVEEGPAREIFREPRHPYTVGLLRSIPRRDADEDAGGHSVLQTIPGSLPSPGSITQGCIFAPRCGLADDHCRKDAPPLYELGGGRGARCHYSDRADEIPLITDLPTFGDQDGAGESEAANGAGGVLEGASADASIAAATPARDDGDPSAAPLIQIRSTSKTFHMTGETVRGLLGVDLDIRAGETVGLVGESGSGKTTLARVLLGIIPPDEGATIQLDGHAWRRAPRAARRPTRRRCRSSSRTRTRRSTAATRSAS